MFAARGAGVSLAMFVLIYALGSIATLAVWRFVLRVLGPASPRRGSNLLFILRILPLALALLVMVGITLPSFLLLEPRSTDESVGNTSAALAVGCVILVLFGIVRVIRAQNRTSQALELWLSDSTRIDCPESFPVFRSRHHSPSLTVAGVREPKVIVSEAAAAALSPAELQTALRHEIVHIRRYDNLKKLIFRLAVFPGTGKLEEEWREQTELAADDAAVSSASEALDLASALIKVSRLASEPAPEFTTGLLHSSTALSERVQRLFAWSETRSQSDTPNVWICGLPAAALLFCLLLTYGSLLSGMHQFTEWLVR